MAYEAASIHAHNNLEYNRANKSLIDESHPTGPVSFKLYAPIYIASGIGKLQGLESRTRENDKGRMSMDRKSVSVSSPIEWIKVL
jgi:hypothetical protein